MHLNRPKGKCGSRQPRENGKAHKNLKEIPGKFSSQVLQRNIVIKRNQSSGICRIVADEERGWGADQKTMDEQRYAGATRKKEKKRKERKKDGTGK